MSFETQVEALFQEALGTVFPDAVFKVLYHGDSVFEKAWGWVDPETRQIPVTSSTYFDLASVTKLFTSTALMSLITLDQLDNPLIEYIPAFGRIEPRSVDGGLDPHSREPLPIANGLAGQLVDPSAVTLRHLLAHVSGLAPWRDVYNAAGPIPVPPDQEDPIPRQERWARALDALVSYPFVDHPGETVRYSDLGLMLLGEVVSRLNNGNSGELDVAINKRVCAPLGLDHVTFRPLDHGVAREDIAPTEFDGIWRKRRCWGEVHDENACGVGGVAGHAGLFATADDLAHFGQAWLDCDPRLGIAPDLMAAAKVEQAQTAGVRRGLGWMLKAAEGTMMGDDISDNAYGHSGFTGTSLFIDPERALVMVLLTNRVYDGRDPDGIYHFRRKLHDLVLNTFVNRSSFTSIGDKTDA